MLTKLLKHEFVATGRVFLPAYGAVLITGAIGFLFGKMNLNGTTVPNWIIVMGSLLYIGLVMATVVVTYVVNIQRFYKNLLGQEGYLMFTLPAKQSELILAKFIPATCWHLASFVVVVLSAALIGLGVVPPSFWSSPDWLGVIDGLRMIYQMIINQYLFVACEAILLVLLSSCATILLMYVSMAIGQLANKGRLWLSIGAYLGITFALQVIVSIFLAVPGLLRSLNALFADSMAVVFGVLIVFYVAQIAAYFFGANAILSKKLNLA